MVRIYRKLRLERKSDLVNPEYDSRKRIADRSRTEHVLFDSRKCIACWECIAACPEIVFGKINIIVHKHAKTVPKPAMETDA
jgi:Pyruvate/2-oxoacid:ferredoxin oxidoreductase delta subunit